jgi:copper ion binding protein
MTQSASISIEGMTCQHCAATVHKALSSVPGVTAVQVDLPRKTAQISFDPQAASVPALMKAVSSAGYKPTGFSRQ